MTSLAADRTLTIYPNELVGSYTFTDNRKVARLMNPTGYRADDWVKVVFPLVEGIDHEGEMIFRTNRGQHYRAVACKTIGKTGTLYRIKVPFDPNQSIVGELISGKVGESPEFTFSDWVMEPGRPYMEVVQSLIPGVIVRVGSKDYEIDFNDMKPVLISSSPAHQEWKIQARVKDSGFVFVGFVTFTHMSDVAEVSFLVTWSDPTNPRLDLDKECTIVIKTGEFTRFRFDKRNGMSEPVVGNDGKWWHYITGPHYISDGMGIAVFGNMLCLPQKPPKSPHPIEPGDIDFAEPDADQALAIQEWDRVANLSAANEDFLCGVCLGWDGTWMANKWIPRLEFLDDEALDYHKKHLALMEKTAGEGFFQVRPLGNAKRPGNTGDQEDFGVSKGTMAVTYGDPRWVNVALYSVQADFLRGYLHYEKDGSDVLYRNHTNWITWSGWTHVRQNPKDKLGKTEHDIWGSHHNNVGWLGWDDQHRSGNNLAAVYALTGNPLIEHLVNHILQSDGAMMLDRVGGVRAIGRLLLWWSNFNDLLEQGDESHVIAQERMDEKIDAVIRKWRGATHNNPVKVVGYATDSRLGITDGKGGILPAWVIWEHGLLAIGLYSAWKVTQKPIYKALLDEIIHTVVTYATFKENDRWYICGNMWYPIGADEGKPITELGVEMSLASPQIALSVTSWTIPLILIACEIYDENHKVGSRAREIALQFTGGKEAQDIRSAEWWCLVKSVARG